jgi:hypothetical protein
MHSQSQNNRIISFFHGVWPYIERNGLWIVMIIILGISWIYDYPEILLKRPQSIHNWRQCDGASLALNYYQEGMQFFKPRTHGLYSDNETTGYTAPSEIPILYYFVAMLYKVFGYHEYLFRLTNLIFFFLGLLYLFKLAQALLKNFFYAAAVVVLLFSSPVIVYYANNFMPNTVALSFTIIGWYYFYQYYLNQKTRVFLIATLFFGLAGAMKITELSSPIIILLLLLADRVNLLNLKLGPKRHLLIKLTSLVSVFMIVAGWIIYAKWYNNFHATSQFSTYTFPLWKTAPEDIGLILHKMKVLWLTDYYLPFTLYSILACALFIIIYYKRADRILGIASVFLLVGLIVYSILWFQALGDHDYFYIGFYTLPVFIFINFFVVLGSFNMKVIYRRLIQVVVLAFLVVNVSHAKQRLEIRYNSWMNDYPEMQDLYKISSYLDQLKISRQNTLVFFPSMNIRPLYLMNIKGWTIWDHSVITNELDNRDSVLMKAYIEKGAGYFITNDIKAVFSRKSLVPFTKDLYGQQGNVYIFRIPPRQENFFPADSLYK